MIIDMLLRNRIISTPTPGVAPRDSFDCHPPTLEWSVFSESFNPINWTTGCISARRRK